MYGISLPSPFIPSRLNKIWHPRFELLRILLKECVIQVLFLYSGWPLRLADSFTGRSKQAGLLIINMGYGWSKDRIVKLYS